jgi:hypothetical protein
MEGCALIIAFGEGRNMTATKFLAALIAAFVCAAMSCAVAAGLEPQADKSVRHAESGWIFPNNVGPLKILTEAQALGGSGDVAASYAKGEGENRIVATVYVYPARSPALDASYDGAKSAIIAHVNGPLSMAQLWSEGPFTVGSDRLLTGRKAFYKLGLGPTSVATNLYFYDVGTWIVKVRVTGKETEDTLKIADAFVRALPWNSLRIAPGECTGYACTNARPVAIHAFVPEMLAMLFTDKAQITPEKSQVDCEASAMMASLAAPPKTNEKGLASPVEKVTDCRAGDVNVGVVRFVLPSEMLAKLVESPDGLTLSGPFTFVVARDGKMTHLAELHDGAMDASTTAAMIARLKAGSQVDFATRQSKDDKLSPVIRFIRQ